MVIIAREFAVTALRMAATQQGVVIAAGPFGKAKTVAQVAMVFALIIVPGSPLWLDGARLPDRRHHGASGADYFFGLRRHLANARGSADPADPRRAVSPRRRASRAAQVPGRDLA